MVDHFLQLFDPLLERLVFLLPFYLSQYVSTDFSNPHFQFFVIPPCFASILVILVAFRTNPFLEIPYKSIG